MYIKVRALSLIFLLLFSIFAIMIPTVADETPPGISIVDPFIDNSVIDYFRCYYSNDCKEKIIFVRGLNRDTPT